jgi:tyrosyl-tRNA synthetase
MNKEQENRLLRRGVAEIIVESELVELLKAGKPLRLKMGFDPSAPDLHLGHAVGLRKLRQLQDLGHRVIVIVGDWTAQIGDPSGQSATRPMLTAEQVLENAESYMAQFFKVVDRHSTELRLQSDWFGSFTLTDVIRLTGRFTVAQLLAREDFAKRFKANHPIAITELLYPLLQAHDSVAVESDVEFGGTDQKFNLLVARDLQRMMGQRPQQCFLMPLLVGTDGVRKMSKSLNNYIALDETPNEMYGKVMSLPDVSSAVDPTGESGGEVGRRYTVIDYFDYLTDVPDRDLEEMRHAMDGGTVNPMDLKKRLAHDLVTQFHGPADARDAEGYFERTVQRKELPDDIQTYVLPPALTDKRISDVILGAGLAKSSADARRLINQGAVRVNDQAISTNAGAVTLRPGDIVRVGRRRMVRIA